jgi:hypothetical protein
MICSNPPLTQLARNPHEQAVDPILAFQRFVVRRDWNLRFVVRFVATDLSPDGTVT